MQTSKSHQQIQCFTRCVTLGQVLLTLRGYACPKGPLVGNWAPILNQSLEAIVHSGLSKALHIKEKL